MMNNTIATMNMKDLASTAGLVQMNENHIAKNAGSAEAITLDIHDPKDIIITIGAGIGCAVLGYALGKGIEKMALDHACKKASERADQTPILVKVKDPKESESEKEADSKNNNTAKAAEKKDDNTSSQAQQ